MAELPSFPNPFGGKIPPTPVYAYSGVVLESLYEAFRKEVKGLDVHHLLSLGRNESATRGWDFERFSLHLVDAHGADVAKKGSNNELLRKHDIKNCIICYNNFILLYNFVNI